MSLDMRAHGRLAYRAVQTSSSYAHLRGAPVESSEKLFLPPDAGIREREAFRAGWREAEGEAA